MLYQCPSCPPRPEGVIVDARAARVKVTLFMRDRGSFVALFPIEAFIAGEVQRFQGWLTQLAVNGVLADGVTPVEPELRGAAAFILARLSPSHAVS